MSLGTQYLFWFIYYYTHTLHYTTLHALGMSWFFFLLITKVSSSTTVLKTENSTLLSLPLRKCLFKKTLGCPILAVWYCGGRVELNCIHHMSVHIVHLYSYIYTRCILIETLGQIVYSVRTTFQYFDHNKGTIKPGDLLTTLNDISEAWGLRSTFTFTLSPLPNGRRAHPVGSRAVWKQGLLHKPVPIRGQRTHGTRKAPAGAMFIC